MGWFHGFSLVLLYFCVLPMKSDDLCPKDCLCILHDTDCSNKGFLSVPSTIDKLTEILYLDGNNFRKISDLTFPQLKKLYLQKSNISSFEAFALHVPLLEFLNISNNSLKTLDSSVFGSLENLQEFHGAYNQIQELKDFTFIGTLDSQLKLVNLSHNEIRLIADLAFSDLISIHTLDLSFNKLTTISPEIYRQMKGLKMLDLSHNYIRATPYEKWPMLVSPMLETLSLANNRLGSSNASEPWFDTPKLTSLDVSYNVIDELPITPLIFLPKLETLYMRGLLSSRIPQTVFRGWLSRTLHNLEISDCRNLLQVEANAFTNLAHLEILVLAGNPRLSRLPAVLTTSQLRILNIGANNLSGIPQSLVLWDEFKDTPRNVGLEGNPWTCDCNLNWTKTHKFSQRIKCAMPQNLTGQLASDLSADSFVCSIPPVPATGLDTRAYFSIVSIVISANIVLGLLVIACWKWKPFKFRRRYRNLFSIYDPLHDQGNVVVHFQNDRVTTKTYEDTPENDLAKMV